MGRRTAVVRRVTCPADDAVILSALAEADKVGIDCPLGWPEDFVAFVTAHQQGAVTVPAGYPDPGWKQRLTLRLTDQVVRRETGKMPLSVSTDLIGHVALRCACLLAESARRGQVIDRSGAGTVVEVYPAAAWLDFGDAEGTCRARHDAFDAVIAALTARAAALPDLTLRPSTPEEAAAAATEGWVAVPLPGARLSQLIG
jgi:hypothetical protein